MTEADLDALLKAASLRLRCDRSLRTGLAAFGIGMLAAAACIVGARLTGASNNSLAWILIAPLAAMIGVFAVTFYRFHPRAEQIAWLIDRRAHSSEHLVTWLYLRKPTIAAANGFLEAQCHATLRRLAAINLREVMPVSLPVWSRALWLAAVLALCALLMPPPEKASSPEAAKAAHTLAANSGGGAASDLAAQRDENQMPRVQILSPTEMRRLELLATDPMMPVALKEQALKELLAKIGNLSERELAPDVRELLETLRADTGHTKDERNAAGSAQHLAETRPGDKNDAAAELSGAARFADFSRDERAWTQIQEHFHDVQTDLERYYKRKGQEGR